MTEFIKDKFSKVLVIFLVVLLVTGWVFSGWPQIWQKPSFPPQVPEVQAQTVIFYETFPNADGAWNGSGDTPQDNPNWATYQGVFDTNDVQVSNEDAGSSPSGGNHLTFEECDDGFRTPEVYDIAYVSIDLSGLTNVVIEYYWQSDDVDAGEGLRVAYSTSSTDGRDGTWIQMAEYLNPIDDVWTRAIYNLPNEAAVSNFKLRFSSRSNATNEHMYVDDIKLTGVVPSATWKAPENIPIIDVNKNENIRLRFQITNIGSGAADYDYLLEYASKVGPICGDEDIFITVPVTASTEHFEMTASIYFANGDPTNVRLTVPDSYTFVAGKMVEDPSNSSGNITLPFESYTEIEFVFQANDNALSGESYCFRLAKAGNPLDDYYIYPELQIAY